MDKNNIILDSQNKILTYIYQNALAGNPEGISLSYSLSANGYGTLKNDTIGSLQKCGQIKMNFNLNGKESMKGNLTAAAEQSTGSEWIFGTSSAIEGRLSYTATKNGSSTTNDKTLNKKDIKVYFVASENCNQLGIDTSKLECKTESSQEELPQ